LIGQQSCDDNVGLKYALSGRIRVPWSEKMSLKLNGVGPSKGYVLADEGKALPIVCRPTAKERLD
jgi:hypothetical protein